MRAKNTSSIGLFYKSVGMLWRVSDCEELSVVGQSHNWVCDWPFDDYWPWKDNSL